MVYITDSPEIALLYEPRQPKGSTHVDRTSFCSLEIGDSDRLVGTGVHAVSADLARFPSSQASNPLFPSSFLLFSCQKDTLPLSQHLA